MNAVAFDTLKTARALESKGFSREQSEALAEQLAEGRGVDLSHLATREDLQAEVARLATKEELKAEVARLDQRITLVEQRITIRFGGMLVIMTGILLAAMRYFMGGR